VKEATGIIAQPDSSCVGRHCMIVHAYYPLGETRVEREALALVRAGWTVDVICLRHSRDLAFETVEGVDIYRLPVQRRKTGGMARQMVEYLRFSLLVFLKLLTLYPRRRYETIQAHNLPDFLIFSALLPKLVGARLILDIHDLMPEFFAARTGLRMDSPLVRIVTLQERLSCWFADHVITVTEVWRNRLISRGVPAQKVSVVMNVADERIFRPLPERKPQEHEDSCFRLIYHGTFKRYYGMEELIRAIGVASQLIPNIHLTLQGVGEMYAEMRELVDDLHLQEHVELNGYALPAEELPALIAEADAGVVPNRNDLFAGDLLPTKLLEYVALRKPVIAARTRVISMYFDDSMVEFFTPGDYGSLAESIIALHDDRERLAKLAQNSQKFVERHNWNSISSQYVGLVARLSEEGSEANR
jgi:glycosyltransferase involved in cell wall biosynthesis